MSADASLPADMVNVAFLLAFCGDPYAVPSDMWRPANGLMVPIPSRPLALNLPYSVPPCENIC